MGLNSCSHVCYLLLPHKRPTECLDLYLYFFTESTADSSRGLTATANLDQFALNVSLYVKSVIFAAICGVSLKIFYDVLKKLGFE